MHQPPNQPSGNWSYQQQKEQHRTGQFTPPPHTPLPSYPPGYQYPPIQPMQPKKKKWPWGWIIGICVAYFLGSFVGAAFGHTTPTPAGTQASGSTSVNTQVTTAPTATQPPATSTPTPQWVVTQKFTGSGNKKTSTFTVGDNWAIVWACNPASFMGGQYNLIVNVYNADGTILDPTAVNTLCKDGNTKDVTQEHQGGSIYLDIESESDWAVNIAELK